MVDQSNLATAQALSSELNTIDQALSIFDEADGRIVNFTIASGEGLMPPRQVTANATYIETPPQMIEAIKTAMMDREQQIRDELAAIGVTGVEAPLRR